ncbi:S28 family serine protease [Streptomyces capitiformicae]|uniref:Tripeptidyl aminopeptidase n=1 Tax=Streptomyces capitiformicae TaxID=2014920 RepID=A0A919DQH9_9ACTN|nr:S28 family serine protease [Streptomyces capitiformicae]GHE67868.1 tripeptidyl aminopeptidase [Streptomyces capitiformicae]
MRKALRWLLALVLLTGTISTAGAATAAQPEVTGSTGITGSADIKDRLLEIPGMSFVEEKPHLGVYRFLVLNYTQPVDHRHPSQGTFQQRITVLHKDVNRPTVFSTTGYNLFMTPGRSEPTRIVDGNEVSMEHRFFTPSRPAPADWSQLDIWQAASDQHRIFGALKNIYSQKWISTGGSKGGMTATYYERFYPRDMDGVVAYTAPNDAVNDEDSAYDRFFRTVGTKECRDRLNAVQREALVRREPLKKRYAEYAEARGLTFDTIGDLDKAYEAVVLDYVWDFWQLSKVADCDSNVIPKDAKNATDDEIWTSVNTIGGLSSYTDQGLQPTMPYKYQAGTQLGAPTIEFPHIEEKYIRYGYPTPRNLVPRDIPMSFQPWVMRDVDTWVRHNAHHMLFVYGENDPWGAEPFRLGEGARDSYVFTTPGANHHGAKVAALVDDEKALATARILEWAGVASAKVQANPDAAKPLAKHDARLDKRDIERASTLRP